jgi:uncharacterized membrane protein
MDFKLVLLAYILPGLAAVLGIPMALGMVPPNRYYGYRTAKTLASPGLWYKANRIAGWCLAIAGILAVCHNTLFLHDHADWPSTTQQFFLAISSAVLLLLGLFVASRYIRKL